VDATTYSASSTGAETISFGTTQNGLTIGTLAGAVASGNVVSLKVNNSSLSGGTTTVTYTVKSGDTLYTIGDGLTSAVNTSSSLQTIGVNSSAPADASYLWSGNFSGSTPLNPGLNTTAVTAVDGAGNTLANNYNLHVNTGSSSALTYDANGNLATKPGATYAFDPENRLQSISFSTNPATQTAFSYDALGRLAMITLSQSGTVTNRKLYVWSGNQIIQERNQTGTATKDYYSLGENRAGTDYFYSKDHLGSIRELTNSSGSVQAQYSYDPYGQATQLQGTLVCDFQFTGVYYEPTSNFNLMVHRAYSSSLGRFISRVVRWTCFLVFGSALFRRIPLMISSTLNSLMSNYFLRMAKILKISAGVLTVISRSITFRIIIQSRDIMMIAS
jgi:YD repeat-containing protein